MTSQGPKAPILATFRTDSPHREAILFGLVASRITGAPLVVATVHRAGPMVSVMGGDVDDAPGEDKRALEHVRLDLQRRGVRKPDVRVIQARRVGAGLVEAMRELSPALVVVGTPPHHGAVGKFLGDTVEAVIHEATCPVAVVPEGHRTEEGEVKVVAVGFSPTDEGQAALATGAALARHADARLRVIEVAGDGEAPSAQLQEAVGRLGDGLDATPEPVTGDPVERLVEASQGVDLLVLGASAHGGRRALGSVSRKVTEQAACPVLIVPGAAAGAADALLAHAEHRSVP